jgi:SAM-dependent methyltransferase
VPIVLRAIEEAGTADVLEFGNVLGHYVPRRHEVVDKYEPGGGVLNVDILDFRPDKSYALIVSISTLEHVGWDDDERDPGKIPRAVRHIRSLLAPGGRAIVTLPLGYNPHVDDMLEAGTLGFDEERCLLRTARDEWREVDKTDLGRPAYGEPFPGANGLVLGIVRTEA